VRQPGFSNSELQPQNTSPLGFNSTSGSPLDICIRHGLTVAEVKDVQGCVVYIIKDYRTCVCVCVGMCVCVCVCVSRGLE